MKLNAAGVGLRIRQARVAKGWTQAHLADALHVQRSSVGRWETGQSVPMCVPLIAKILGHPADWFLAKADEGTMPTTEAQEIKRLRSEIRRLTGKLKAPKVVSEKSTKKIKDQIHKDQTVLNDVLDAWNKVNSETRLMAALLITGDWSYKLKLWNRDVAVSDDVLKAVNAAHRNIG